MRRASWTLLAVLAFCPSAFAQQIALWQGGAGTWNNANNWICPPPGDNHCVPQGNFDVSDISPGTVTVDAPVNVSSILFTGTGVVVNGSSLTAGVASIPTLTISNGAVVTGGTTGPLAVGSLTVSGQNSLLDSGNHLVGTTLQVIDGGTLSGNGEIDISGESVVSGGLSSVQTGFFVIAPTGALTIENGAKFDATGQPQFDSGVNGTLNITNGAKVKTSGVGIADDGSNPHAVVTVVGQGTEWTATHLGVGVLDGLGVLGIGGPLAFGDEAKVTVGTPVNPGTTVIGVSAGSHGVVEVGLTSAFVTEGAVTVGLSGEGSVFLQGGTMRSWPLRLGVNAGSQGTVSSIFDGKVIVEGDLVAGGNGHANVSLLGSTLFVFGQATLASGGSAITDAVVRDSVVGITGDFIVGGSGHAAIEIVGSQFVNEGTATIGRGATGSGAVFIHGSQWDHPTLIVGDAGKGELEVKAALVGTDGNAVVGAQAGSVGVVNLYDAAQWKITGDLTVGRLGLGDLHVSGEADVRTMGDLVIGKELGSLGTVTVTGAGSSLIVDGHVQVGSEGSGLLRVRDGAHVVFGEGIVVGSEGVLSIKAGTVEGDTIIEGGGVLKGDDPAPINIVGDLIMDADSLLRLVFEGAGPNDYDYLNLLGNLDFNGDLQFDFTNAFAPTTGTSFDIIRFTGTALWDPGDVLFTGLLPGNLHRFDIFSDRIALTALNNWISITAPGPGDPPGVPEPSVLILVGAGGLYGVRAYRRQRLSRA